MDQKNTIVKCNATTCLYNHKGICDQYVIDLDMYGQCKDYCECEKTEAPAQLKSDLKYDEAKELIATPENIGAALKFISQKMDEEREAKLLYDNAKKMLEKVGVTLIEPKDEPKRGKRAKCNFIEDGNTSAICYWCDFFNSEKKKCKKHHPLPEVNQTCPYIQSTGANQ